MATTNKFGEQLNVTELDFQTIKENLLEYLRNSDSDFTDWDFEGSNLNTIVDMLAYNTHYNAMLAHLAVNESFLDSAQLRSSVVSAAKLLNYIPRSRTAARATICGQFSPAINTSEIYTFPRGTTFSLAGIDEKNQSQNFQYVILDDFIQVKKDFNGKYLTDDDYETTGPIVAYEGRLVKTAFNVTRNSLFLNRYQIDDKNIDITSLRVNVYPTSAKTSGSATTFQRFARTVDVDENSTVYFINENSFGYYEISFGDGKFGKRLTTSNVIEIEYLVTSGSRGNGFQGNVALLDIPGIAIEDQFEGVDILITKERTAGGAEKESLNRLKANATKTYIAQDRAVTAEDYRALVQANFQFVQNITVWGGEDNDPPEYGKVFMTIAPYASYNSAFISNADKSAIENFIKSKNVLAILPEVVDPHYINIVLDILFKVDPKLLDISRAELQNQIKTNILNTYNTSILNIFDTVFRHSQLQGEVDNYHPAIINSLVRVFVKQSFIIRAYELRKNVTINFGVPLEMDDGRAIAEITTSGAWTDGGVPVSIGEEAGTNEDERNLFTYTLSVDNLPIRLNNIGTLYLTSGRLDLNTSLFTDTDVEIGLTVYPKSNDIVAKRNLLLKIDETASTVSSSIDEIAAGGSSETVRYNPFNKDRSS